MDFRTDVPEASPAARRLKLIDETLRPPEPQLLDTCVLQNLDWVDRKLEAGGGIVRWDSEAERALTERYGMELADDLLDLGTLYKCFEDRGGYPWLVCNSAVDEAGLLEGSKGDRLRQIISFFAGHQNEWDSNSYPSIAQGHLLSRRPLTVPPLILRALGVSTPGQIADCGGPLSFLPDRGDRLLAAYALLSNVPALLTTDRRTFWAHRERLQEFGIQVLRPSELLKLYLPYWQALDFEFARRRAPQ